MSIDVAETLNSGVKCKITLADVIIVWDGSYWELLDVETLEDYGLRIQIYVNPQYVTGRNTDPETGRTTVDLDLPAGQSHVLIAAVVHRARKADGFLDMRYKVVMDHGTCRLESPSVEVTLVSTSIAGLSCPTPGQSCPQEAEGRIRFNLTALGGDAYVAQADVDATGGVGFTSFLKSSYTPAARVKTKPPR